MKVVLAFDSFKGSLSAAEACRITADALSELRPDLELILIPLADGGEGTAAALMNDRNGEWISAPATGPLASLCVDAGFAWFPFDKSALVETASASGLTLLRADQRNPLFTSTLGTGELLRAAADYGAQRILLAAGGSATVDGGMGAAHALGWRFLDHAGRELPPCGQNLEHIARIVRPVDGPTLPEVDLLADVDNTLLGERGAARIFGPQKGASPAAVQRLETGLHNLSERIQQDLGLTVADVPGAGAAGGLGAGALAFFRARLVSGIETVLREVDFETSISGADWVITGEGCLDPTSLQGKVVSGVLRCARTAGARTAVLAGRIKLSPEEWTQAGLSYAAPLATPQLSTDEAIQLAPQLLHDQAQHFAREWL